MSILKPDKILNYNGLQVNQYFLTQHNPNKIAMPTAQLPAVPLGVTIHNTGSIRVSGTTMAEQYTRATVNGNMKTVRVHFYVDDKCAWQTLPLTLSSWHAADGNGNGNRKTISIECIGDSREAEKNAIKLIAYLLNKYNLTVEDNLFTHTHWLNVRDGIKGSNDYLNTRRHPYKYCPQYILPHWSTFKSDCIKELNSLKGKKTNTVTETNTTQTKDKDNNKGNLNVPDVFYRVYIKDRWLPEVKNTEDYAGIKGKPIRGIGLGSKAGKMKYRVHVLGGDWYDWITEYNIKDWKNGVAGWTTIQIDALQIDLDSSDYDVEYRVSSVNKASYYPWVINTTDYAGVFGRPIDRVQIRIIKEK